jgi:hypothetical protein
MRVLLLLLCTTLSAQQSSWRGTSNSWSPFQQDKGLHVFAGAMIGSAAYITADWLGYKKPWIHALFWAALAGYLKERYDRQHGGRPEYADALWTAGGGLGVSFLIYKTNPPDKSGYVKGPKAEIVIPDIELPVE